MIYERYDYRIVGQGLVRDLLVHIENAEPFVLFGPPGAGKRLLLIKLRRAMNKRRWAWIAIVLRDHQPVHSERELLELLLEPDVVYHSKRIGDAEVQQLRSAKSLDEFFQLLEGLDRQYRGFPLVFANLDGLCDQLLFRLMTFVRLRQEKAAVERYRASYAFTGERLLMELVNSRTSPIRPHYRYVIQGHDRTIVARFCKARIEAMQLHFHSEWDQRQAINRLIELSQGDLNLVRVVLLAVSESRLAFGRNWKHDPGIRREAFEQELRHLVTVPLYGLQLFHLARTTIDHHRDMLDLVELLVNRLRQAIGAGTAERSALRHWREAEVSLDDERWIEYRRRPTPLELTGLIRRHPSTKTVRFSCPYAADYAYHYFTESCLGDFFLRQRRFDESAARYDAIPADRRIGRPLDNTDYQFVRVLVQRLCRRFAETAVFPDEEGKYLATFCAFARHLLGFKNVSMWRLHADRPTNGPRWEQLPLGRGQPPPKILDCLELVPMAGGREKPEMILDQDEPHRISAYGLSFDHPANDGVAIVLEDAEANLFLSASRSQAAATLAHHFLLAWCHARDRHHLAEQRGKLGDALAQMLREEGLDRSLLVLGEYMMKSFCAHAVRLYLVDRLNHEKLVSTYQLGLENPHLAERFQNGDVTVTREESPEVFYSAITKKPTVFRWCPTGSESSDRPESPDAAAAVDYVLSRVGHIDELERKAGDYWIDFPLFKENEFFGKLVLAFRSNQPPPKNTGDSLEHVSELLAQHLRNLEHNAPLFAERRSILRKATSVISHDLKTRLSSLANLGAELLLFAETVLDQTIQKRLLDIARALGERLDISLGTIALASKWLEPIRLSHEVFAVGKPIRSSLPTIDPRKGVVELRGDESICMRGDAAYLDAVFRELISDSSSMYNSSSGLLVRINISAGHEPGRFQIDYRDNGPGVADKYKKKIFDYFVSHRPGQEHEGMGMGLGLVREIIAAHGGTIEEIGLEGEGVHFRIRVPICASDPKESEDASVQTWLPLIGDRNFEI